MQIHFTDDVQHFSQLAELSSSVTSDLHFGHIFSQRASRTLKVLHFHVFFFMIIFPVSNRYRHALLVSSIVVIPVALNKHEDKY